MTPFTTHTGRAVPLRRSNVDTDQIIPSDWLKRVERTGFGAGLFSEWRSDPDFVLSQPQYAGASVLVAGQDFGTGSSREQAATALKYRGIEMGIAASFSQTYLRNAFNNAFICLESPDLATALAEGCREAAESGDKTIEAGAIDIDFRSSSATWNGAPTTEIMSSRKAL